MQTRLTMPVAPFEHYMYADDRRTTPMTFFIRAGFSGRIDRARLRDAIRLAQTRHPLTGAVISGNRKARTRDLSWREAKNPAPHLGFSAPGEPIAYPDGEPYLDLRNEVGLRCFVTAGDESAGMLVQVHHAVCDAVGITRFLEDVLQAYDAADEEPRADGGRLPDAALLARRSDLGMSRLQWLGRLPRDMARLSRLFRSGKPMKTAAGTTRQSDPIADLAFPASVSAVLAPAVENRMRQEAGAAGGTLNDVLVRNLFLAVHAQNARHGEARAIRLSIPTDLRAGAFEALPAANMVGMALVERRAGDMNDPQALLKGIVRETRRIKQKRLGIGLHRAVSLYGTVRGGLVHACVPSHCYSTAVLSNLGRPLADSPLAGPDGRLRAGGLVLDDYALLPPVRPLTHAAIGVVTYAGSVRLTANYDPRVVGAEEAAALLRGVTNGPGTSVAAATK